jgi:hypothetical protein
MEMIPKMVRVGRTQIRHMVTYRGDPCPEEGPESWLRQAQLLRTIADSSELCKCGPSRFQKMRMFYSGNEWVIELEAVVDANPDGTAQS